MRDQARAAVGRAIRALCVRHQTIAISVGVSYDAVRSWASDRSVPTRENRDALERLLTEHAAEIRGALADLRAARRAP